MYHYYYIHTDCYSNAWDTAYVEQFIESTNLFSGNGKGAYTAKEFFCSLQLLRVRDWNSWNENDYDSSKTNYISIVIDEKSSDKREEFFKCISEHLGWRIIKDES